MNNLINVVLVENGHRKAMELADLAFISKQKGDIEKASVYSAQACKCEEEAALATIELEVGQPSVGILYRSAATLASDAGDMYKMLSLTQKALKTNLLPWQVQEFLELLNDNKIYVESLDEAVINRLIADMVLAELKTKGKTAIVSHYQKKRKKINA